MKTTYDNFTSTVDGARGFAETNYEPEYDDTPSMWELEMDEREDEDEEDCEDECNCSDPGCPCGGWKTGGF